MSRSVRPVRSVRPIEAGQPATDKLQQSGAFAAGRAGGTTVAEMARSTSVTCITCSQSRCCAYSPPSSLPRGRALGAWRDRHARCTLSGSGALAVEPVLSRLATGSVLLAVLQHGVGGIVPPAWPWTGCRAFSV